MSTGLTSRLRAPAAAALAGAALAAALLVRDPHVGGSWGRCPFLLLTGVPCPACGGLRATNDLLHGRLTDALHSNAYAVGTAGVAVLSFAVWVVAAASGRSVPLRRHSTPLLVAWFCGLVVFGLVRLLPGLSGLRP